MATTSATTRVDELMEDMTLRQKATQLLMPDFRHWAQENQSQVDFDVMNDEVKQILIEYDFGGVILFAQNVKETEQTARLTDALQKAALDDNEGNGHSIPLLITIDQEGGIVTRLGTGTALP
ncbi:glycoside hydrolase family 3 N-terminal domain-containing protein, partial [Leclercia adecarboxylata]|uniref:glycoside hydrolase family 3 N-terminal domain-containing protein n=1 Tax=Leclercia adecarboxylata TaxID=83655 RepID=UPI00234D5181